MQFETFDAVRYVWVLSW